MQWLEEGKFDLKYQIMGWAQNKTVDISSHNKLDWSVLKTLRCNAAAVYVSDALKKSDIVRYLDLICYTTRLLNLIILR